MSKVTMNVARNSGGQQEYIISKHKPKVITQLCNGEKWFGAKYGRHTMIDAEEFHKMFNFHLDPSQGPVEITFNKIEVEVVG